MKKRHLLLSIIILFAACGNDKDELSISIFQEIADLPTLINECSGFALNNDRLVAINDSGDDASIYLIDLIDFTLSDQVLIANTQNKDWETIIANDNYFWIGDFGNNFGNRMDLIIYKINATSLLLEDSIAFAYPDQNDFANPIHNFDCEAMINVNESIFLFTKNRQDDKTNIYQIDLEDNSIVFIQSINVPAPVTDAYYHEPSEHVLLLCNDYMDGDFNNYIQVLEMDTQDRFSSKKSFAIPINEQFEAITLLENNTFYIASENESMVDGKIYRFQLDGL